MVKVLRSHHFTGQYVLNSEDEPLAVCSSEENLFVATEQCFIEVYDILEDGCPRSRRIPTVGMVENMVYNEADNYIATIEVDSKKVRSIRMYLNWTADLSLYPMRARVAGNLAGYRLEEGDGDRLEVVEIPLKEEANCIATCDKTGNLAIAIGKKLIIYGLCCKILACCKKVYEDAKSLLELQFDFKIKQVAICEEFVLSVGRREFQVIRFNLDDPYKPFTKETHLMSRKLPDGTTDVTEDASRHISSLDKTTDTDSSDNAYISHSNNVKEKSTNYITDDAHNFTLNFDGTKKKAKTPFAADPKGGSITKTATNKPGFVRQASSMDGASHQVQRTFSPMMNQTETIVLNSVKRANESSSTNADGKGGTEIIGPLKNTHSTCPVFVEFEDTCGGCSEIPSGVLEKGVSILLYRKFSSKTNLHSAQFQPVYYPGGPVTEKSGTENYDNFISGRRPSLIGLYCFVSNEMEGYAYEVFGDIHMISTYPYTSEAYEVSLKENLLFVLSEPGLEVYTTRTLCSAMHAMEQYDKDTEWLPQWDMEPCMIGIQPFIDVETFTVNRSCVSILSKSLDAKHKSNDSWSLYILKRPQWKDLVSDMTELAVLYKPTSIPPFLQLMLEAHVLIRTQIYFRGSTKESESIHDESCLQLGLHYAGGRNLDETKLSLPYLKMSSFAVLEILTKFSMISSSGEIENPSGILLFLNQIVFDSADHDELSQEEGDLILEMYAALEPHKLSSVLVQSNLRKYSNEKAAAVLRNWIACENRQHTEAKKLDLLAMAVVSLNLGNPGEAEVLLFSMPKVELTNLCVKYHHMLHSNCNSFSALAQLLRKHNPDVFLEILLQLNDSILNMDSALSLLKGNDGISSNTHERLYLEKLLNDEKKSSVFKEASIILSAMYMELLSTDGESLLCDTPLSYKETVPQGSGHFSPRYQWLDSLPPFLGRTPAQSPCEKYFPGKPGQPKTHPMDVNSSSSSLTNDNCACFMCNATLLKLQSLLCSKWMDTNVCEKLLSKLESRMMSKLNGLESIRILCLTRTDSTEAMDYIIENYPTIASQFTCETFHENQEMWAHVTDKLFSMLRSKETSSQGGPTDTSYSENKSALNDVLEKLATLMSPTDFMNLLPSDGSLKFFIGHMEDCVKAHQAQELRNSIIEQANQL